MNWLCQGHSTLHAVESPRRHLKQFCLAHASGSSESSEKQLFRGSSALSMNGTEGNAGHCCRSCVEKTALVNYNRNALFEAFCQPIKSAEGCWINKCSGDKLRDMPSQAAETAMIPFAFKWHSGLECPAIAVVAPAVLCC